MAAGATSASSSTRRSRGLAHAAADIPLEVRSTTERLRSGGSMPQSFEIHPSSGIGRLGTSQDFFIGPEPDGARPASYRDGAGDLLRQAARFRVFDCQRDEEGVLQSASEVTPTQAQVSWTVQV